MRARIASGFATAAVALLLGYGFTYALDVPPLRARINDLAALIGEAASSQLEENLRQFEEATHHQIAVLTIPSLEGDDLEAFSIRVAEAWKIGQKGADNGVILIVARDDRKIRIEVGYGLEGALPDAIASRIIREVMLPRFREQNFAAGISDGLAAIEGAISGEALPHSENRQLIARNRDLWGMFVFYLLIYLPSVMMRRLYAPPSRAKGALIGASVGAGAGAIAGILSSLVGLQIGAIGFLAFLILASALGVCEGLLGARRAALLFGRRRDICWSEPFYVADDGYSVARDRDRPSGGYGSGHGSGSYRSSGSGGRGFSGGGGGFGGGGASGGW